MLTLRHWTYLVTGSQPLHRFHDTDYRADFMDPLPPALGHVGIHAVILRRAISYRLVLQ